MTQMDSQPSSHPAKPRRKRTRRWVVAALLIGGAAWLAGRAHDQALARAHGLTVDLGPYHIVIPPEFPAEAGMPGDPRRSKYVFMTVPLQRIGLPPSPWLAAHPNTGVVPSLHLDPDDAERLRRYAHISPDAQIDQYRGYTGRVLGGGFYLYTTTHPGEPLYLTCPEAASDPRSSWMDCNVEETVISGSDGQPDLTVEFAFPWDFWPELPELSAAIKAFAMTLVTVKPN